VELGAGVGLVGLAARALGAAKVVLTDVAAALPRLERNALLNYALCPDLCELQVELLDFRVPLGRGSPARGCDMVCCSDCVLWPEIAVPLQQTLDRLLGEGNVGLLSVVHRGREAGEFLDHLRRAFRVEDVWASPAQQGQDAGHIQILRMRRWPLGSGFQPGFDKSLELRGAASEWGQHMSPRLQQLCAHMMQEGFKQESREICVMYPASPGRPGVFRARMLTSAVVGDLRLMCGNALPCEAEVLCDQGKGKVVLQDMDPLPDHVSLSKFRGTYSYYCLFNQAESAVALESMRLSWQRPDVQEQLLEIGREHGVDTLKYRLARAHLLICEIYPPVMRLLHLPEDEDAVRIVIDGNKSAPRWLDTSYAQLEVALMSRVWGEAAWVLGIIQEWHAGLGMPPPIVPWDGMDPLARAAWEEFPKDQCRSH